MEQGKALWSGFRPDAELDVVGVGESSLDHVCVVEAWPRAGGKQLLREADERPGGQVASAMLGCARLGLRTAYMGAVGADVAAEVVLEPLRRAGVDLTGVRRIEGARTRSAVVIVRASDGERTVLAYRDPRLRLAPDRLRAGEIERARVLHVDASDPDLSCWAARTARGAGIPVVLDADHCGPGVDRLIAVIDFPVVSLSFAEEWGGTGAAADGLAKLAGGGARLAVVTCGAEGALARAGDETWHSPALAGVEVRDTTGAGDAFHAGFIWGLLQGFAVERVLRVANAVAGLACSGAGAQEGLPTREALMARLAGDEPAGAAQSGEAPHVQGGD